MNDNTVLRIKVPAHLYESVKEQLTINEAHKEISHELLQKMLDDLLATYGETEMMKSNILVALRGKINDMLNNMHPQLKTKFREETINEAKKAGKAFGDWTVVKEKKMSVPKDGMKKVEEAEKMEEAPMKKERTLDELKAAKAQLDKKIMEMESANKVEEAKGKKEEEEGEE